MPVQLYFNELSTLDEFRSFNYSKLKFSEFIHLVKSLINSGCENSLYTPENFTNTKLSENYHIYNWINDDQVDIDLKRFLKLKLSRSQSSDIEKDNLSLDILYEGRQTTGIKLAYIHDGLSISLPLNQCWEQDVNCTSQELDDVSGDLNENNVVVKNISIIDEIVNYQDWINEKLSDLIIDGNSIWDQRKILFKNIDFSPSTQKQLQSIPSGSPHLNQVLNKLQAINTYCEECKVNDTDLDLYKLPFKITGEHENIHKNDKSKTVRTIMCSDGLERFFELHARLTPGDWRMYFYPVNDSSTVLLGYIGRKLYSLNFPT